MPRLSPFQTQAKLTDLLDEMRTCAREREHRLHAFQSAATVAQLVKLLWSAVNASPIDTGGAVTTSCAAVHGGASEGMRRGTFLNLHLSLRRAGYFQRPHAVHLCSPPHCYVPPAWYRFVQRLDGCGEAGGDEEEEEEEECAVERCFREWEDGCAIWREVVTRERRRAALSGRLSQAEVQQQRLTYDCFLAALFELADSEVSGRYPLASPALLLSGLAVYLRSPRAPVCVSLSLSDTPFHSLSLTLLRPRTVQVERAYHDEKKHSSPPQHVDEEAENLPRADRPSPSGGYPGSKEWKGSKPLPGRSIRLQEYLDVIRAVVSDVLLPPSSGDTADAAAVPGAPPPVSADVGLTADSPTALAAPPSSGGVRLMHSFPAPETHRAECMRKLGMLRIAVATAQEPAAADSGSGAGGGSPGANALMSHFARGPTARKAAMAEFRAYCHECGKRRGALRLSYSELLHALQCMPGPSYAALTFRVNVMGRPTGQVRPPCHPALLFVSAALARLMTYSPEVSPDHFNLISSSTACAARVATQQGAARGGALRYGPAAVPDEMPRRGRRRIRHAGESTTASLQSAKQASKRTSHAESSVPSSQRCLLHVPTSRRRAFATR